MMYQVRPVGHVPGYIPWGPAIVDAYSATEAARIWAEKHARNEDIRVEVTTPPRAFVVRADYGCSTVNETR